MENKTFEEALDRVREISENISAPDITVDKAVALYQESAALLAHCERILKDAALRVEEVDTELADEL